MDRINLETSLKNIPTPTKSQYQKILVSKIESLLSRLRWQLQAIKDPGMKSKFNYGFKTTLPPPQFDELKAFEEELYSLAKNIEFKRTYNKFQAALSRKIKEIRATKEIIVKADKTSNMYKIPAEQYRKILGDNITKEYKKTTYTKVKSVNGQAARIAQKLGIEDRVDCYIEANAFLTIKDHKESFPGRIECRLLNPAKSNIGKISKVILEKAVKIIKTKTNLNQWKNTDQVIQWFNSLQDKQNLKFIKFDVESFYPSITEHLLNNTLDWAKSHHTFTKEEIDIILHARKSFLFSESNVWTKKNNNTGFDVTMGSYDGAELCEFVGLYILHKLHDSFGPNMYGIYRDDALGVIRGPGPYIERTRKKIFQIFKDMSLGVKIEGNLERTDFLDVIFDLKKGTIQPFRKDLQTPMYINVHSNHPPRVIKELPNMIASRISKLSSTKQIFDSEIPVYQTAINNAGYTSKLNFTQPSSDRKKRVRKRNIIWFNPPYSKSVSTNVGAKFLQLIDKHFKGKALGKFFNRSTVKISYCCTPNLDRIISGHNSRILGKKLTPSVTCNCRQGAQECPLGGKCLVESIVYKADVTSDNTTKSYIGLAKTSFKERYNNHTMSLNHRQHSNRTSLSKYIWSLRDEKKQYTLAWSILGRAPSYTPVAKQCGLCVSEKTAILVGDNLLNQRSELLSKCRHRHNYLLNNFLTQ